MRDKRYGKYMPFVRFRVPKSLADRLAAYAKADHTNATALVRQAVRELLERMENSAKT